MTSSSAGTAASHAPPHLHISTNITPPSSHHQNSHSPVGNARSPHPNQASPRAGGGAGSGSGSTNQACAACKYQRRKCNPDCPLAPYFPADQQRRFLHAHRLFGVSNILKALRRLRPELCAEAMSSLIFQAEMRAQDPVGGCYRLILTLERQYEMERAELAAVLHHLALCRQAAAAVPPQHDGGGVVDLDVTSSNNQQPTVLLSADQEAVDALYANHHHQEVVQAEDHPHDGHSRQDHQSQQQQQLFDYFYYDTTNGAGDDASSRPVSLDINVDTMHQLDYEEDVQKVMAAPAVHDEQHLDLDVFDMRQAVDLNADNVDIDVKDVGLVNASDININASVDLNEDLQEKDTKYNIIAAGEAATQIMEGESSQCRLGLAFSAL